VTLWRFLHLLSLFWLMAGIGNTVVPAWRAWLNQDLEERALLLVEAQRNESTWLLPGMIATVVSGYAWAAAGNYNVITTGWLLALQIVLAVDIFIFLPMMGVGLRRVRLLALQARKQGEVTDALRDALADNVPLVFGTLIVVTVPVMLWLSVFKPF